MSYIGKTTDGFGVRDRFVYVVSAGATSVSGPDANGATLKFTDGAYVDVYLNGVLLKPTTDYNTSTANTIAGISSMSASDEVTVVVYDVFTVADTVSATSGGTFNGAITTTTTNTTNGTFLNTSAHNTANGVLHVKQSGATNNPTMVIEQTGDGGNGGDTQGLHIKIAGQTQGTGKAIRVTTTNASLNSGSAYDAFSFTNGGEISVKNSSNQSTLSLSSAGYLTKPRHPYFAVRRGNGAGEQFVNASNSGSVAVPVTFDTEELDPFSMFNNSTYKVSIPVSGVYAFHWSVLTGILIPSSGVNWCAFELMLNDSTASRISGTPKMYEEVYNASGSANAGVGGSGRYFKKVTGSCQVYVSSSDTVRLMFYCSDSTNARIHSGSHSTFCGYLLG